MNPPCAKCKKTVYPVEKLNCLDKVWHKACFRCETCNLKLTMNTYKGYNKMPYCKTHYPTTKFTAVSDTPENKRLAQQTRNQSELTYRKDKEEAMKGFTPVADSVGNMQARQQQLMASNIGYQQETAPAPVRPPPEPVQQFQPPPQPMGHPPPPAPAPAPSGPRYIAVYDYTAADDDEVSFNEGDEIVDVEVIDDGWMEGRVKRTGEKGMLPSNYVEKQ